MKTLKRTFPELANDYLENILRQLVNQFDVVQLFYNKAAAGSDPQLVIHLKQKQDADRLQAQPWVEKVRSLYQIRVCCMYATRLHHFWSLGNPFVEAYCRPQAVIYQNNEHGKPLLINRVWAKYKKKYFNFEERFYNYREDQLEQLQKLVAERAVNSVFMAYKRLFEYDFEYLEYLYLGNRSFLSMEDRIDNLIQYCPEIQKYFVRRNGSAFFITDLFAKAKKGIAEDEVIFDDDQYESVRIAENGLYELIGQRLIVLKKAIKKSGLEKQVVPMSSANKPQEQIVEAAVTMLVKTVEVEQVYRFHQTGSGAQQTHYLLLVSNGLDNEKLRLLTQSINSKGFQDHDFVLIGHGRYWIQKNLFQYQHFFKLAMDPKNLIYASGPYHPELHWETPYEPSHGDLSYFLKLARNSGEQFLLSAKHGTGNYQGLEYIFVLFFQSFCRLVIYKKRYYMPNSVPNLTLWKLCIYADPGILDCGYLITQFKMDFFTFLDNHQTLQQRLSKLDDEVVGQMLAMVEKLMGRLDGYDI